MYMTFNFEIEKNEKRSVMNVFQSTEEVPFVSHKVCKK